MGAPGRQLVRCLPGLRPHRGAPEGPESPGDLGGCPDPAAQAALGEILADVVLAEAAAIPVSEETSQAREGGAGSPGAPGEENAEEAAKKGEGRSRSRKRRRRSRSRKRTKGSRKSRSRARD